MELLDTIKKTKHKPAYFEVAKNVWGMRILFVNIYMVQNPDSQEWVLIDTGLKGYESHIIDMAEDLFGENAEPSAILLTHGHFDHTGGIEILLEKWNIPVYAHMMELPYLIGKSAYPPPDATAGGGIMSYMAWAFPKDAIDIGRSVNTLPEDEKVPVLNDWKYIHTPGHTPGHVSFFREKDKTLIVGDAFVTTQQESAFSVMTQKKKICGPPRYFTPDWPSAEQSVIKLAGLRPEVVAAGHGKPCSGEELNEGLEHLVMHFHNEAIPREGRYVTEPARADESGVIYVPPLNTGTLIKAGLAIFAGIAAAILLFGWLSKKK